MVPRSVMVLPVTVVPSSVSVWLASTFRRPPFTAAFQATSGTPRLAPTTLDTLFWYDGRA